MTAVNAVVSIDPDAIADVLDEVQEKLGEQVDSDRIWEKVYGKEMAGVETQFEDVIPSVEDMEKQLEDEVAAELGGRTAERVAEPGETESSVGQQIGEARKRLKDLLEGDK